MRTELLIETLAADVAPVPRFALWRRLALGTAVGGAVSLMVVMTLLGVRADFARAIGGFSFWLKWAYTISTSLIALATVVRLARSDGSLRFLWLLLLPFGLLTTVGIIEMAHVAPGDWLTMWLGKSWRVCSSLVALLAVPIFVGLLWSFKKLAPTRLRAAGATAGLASGAWAAAIYCVHCPEVSAIFVLTWYTIGIAFSALIGMVLGPRLLRW